jgi:predicted Zn-dependent protease with MMP-like domain
MIDVNQADFEEIVSKAIDAIPALYYKKLQNVVFIVEDIPSEEQREKLKLHCNQTLYGLYEGIPLTRRGSGYNLVLPDKITIFRLPILQNSNSLIDVQKQVHKTVWHEVAHYYGLDHGRIHKLENKSDH